jgi:glutamate-ammonia-ligase adenylyltransferase
VRPRTATAAAALARLGFVDAKRAERLLATPTLAPIVDDDEVLGALGASADPDLALLGLDRLLETATDPDRLIAELERDAVLRRRLFAVLGMSAGLADHLARHPDDWHGLAQLGLPAPRPTAQDVRAELLEAVGADPASTEPVATVSDAVDAMRAAYRRALMLLAARDLADSLDVGIVAGELADLAAAALEAGLAIARADYPAEAASARLAIIGMGKCGGQELNYVSDVDVVFVAEQVEPSAEADAVDDAAAAVAAATTLATAVMRACAESSTEPPLWVVDAALRPEGKSGPLVRRVASHRDYYERWAKTWEFQALLKARPVAGDVEVGQDYMAAIGPLVWRAAERDGFVSDVQAMRRRVEEHIPRKEVDRHLKLGAGGLRDIEFAVQMLQLVHGRADESLRSRSTLGGLAALTSGGYVGREDGSALASSYRFLRSLEHRVQLYKLRRTHLMPISEDDRRRLGRSLGYVRDPVGRLDSQLKSHRSDVRRLHEKIFYRPLLDAVARLPSEEVRLTTDAAKTRLKALGYRDPAGALRHIESLTRGVSRRASIQRTLLPVLLGWFADGVDPDAGLRGFREVSDALGETHWYLSLLRDEQAAAERMARVLASSRFATELLLRAPEAVQLLGEESTSAGAHFSTRAELEDEVRAVVARHDDAESAIAAVRAMRRHELFGIAVADLGAEVGVGPASDETLPVEQIGAAVTAVAQATVLGALELARRGVADRHGADLDVEFGVVAMGRLGGHEMAYSSDADVMYVYRAGPQAGEAEAARYALAIAQEMHRLLALPSPEPPLLLDADLRPEGRSGPLVRSLGSYEAYYERWGEVWERQALLRAEPMAGSPGLLDDMAALIDPLRWSTAGLSADELREVRRIKARVESERLPRGVDKTRHLKLGPGGLADVEWTVQTLQLQHAGEVAGLRTTETVAALRAAVDADLIERADAQVLIDSWRLVGEMRNAIVHVTGRASDVLPKDGRVLESLARVLGHAPGEAAEMQDEHARATRRARRVVNRIFYGEE